MDKTLEQLARYVHQQLQQGASEQNIRAALAQNRWTPDWIDAVFNVVHQNPTMFSAPSIQPPESPKLQSPSVKPTALALASPASPSISPVQRPVSTRTTKSKKGLFIVLVSGLVLLGLAAGAYFMFLPKQSNPQTAGPQTSTTKPQEEQKPPKAPDEKRKEDLNVILSDLADFYVAHKNYPTHEALKSKGFADKYPEFDTKALADPKWTADNKDCSDDGRAIVTAKPAPFCYSYAATTSEGTVCDNAQVPCTRLTVTTVFENGTPYAITLDRNTVVAN